MTVKTKKVLPDRSLTKLFVTKYLLHTHKVYVSKQLKSIELHCKYNPTLFVYLD